MKKLNPFLINEVISFAFDFHYKTIRKIDRKDSFQSFIHVVYANARKIETLCREDTLSNFYFLHSGSALDGG